MRGAFSQCVATSDLRPTQALQSVPRLAAGGVFPRPARRRPEAQTKVGVASVSQLPAGGRQPWVLTLYGSPLTDRCVQCVSFHASRAELFSASPSGLGP